MNELKELEEWLTRAIKCNEIIYEYSVNANDNNTIYSCVGRRLAYERVLRKIYIIQRAQKRGEI